MLLLDVTVVNEALPVIRDDLDASFAELQSVIDAYALTLVPTCWSPECSRTASADEPSSPPACTASCCSSRRAAR
jgi:hypothetical protein